MPHASHSNALLLIKCLQRPISSQISIHPKMGVSLLGAADYTSSITACQRKHGRSLVDAPGRASQISVFR